MDNAPASPTPPTPPTSGAPNAVPPKKSGIPVLVWVLLGCGGIVLMGILLFAVLGFFLWRKVDNAVHVEKGKVTLRGDKGETITVTTDNQGSDKGSFTFKDDKGTVTFGGGADAKLPSWMPNYPGSSPEGCFSVKTDKGDQLGCSFGTADSPVQVKNFYDAKLKALGFDTKGGYQAENGPIQTAAVTAQHTDGRQVTATAVREEGKETKVVLQIVTPK